MDVKLLSGSDDVKDEVLEKLKSQFMGIQQKLPVILALGNKDLRPYHWKEIYEKMDCGMSYEGLKDVTISGLDAMGAMKPEIASFIEE
jgi:dynein heavy chain